MSKRVVSLELLRILACLAVITIHVSALKQESSEIQSFAWQTLNVYNALSRFSVPVFVMISGMFMLDPKKELPMNRLYIKYVLRMLAVWVAWEIFYALVHFRNMEYALGAGTVPLFIKTALEGHFHLWYLPMLIGLYMSTPFLRAITEKCDRRLIEYFLLLFFIFTVLRSMLPLFYRPEDPEFNELYYYFICFWDKIPLAVTGRYLGYYMLGYYLSKYPLSPKIRRTLYVFAAAGAFWTVALSLDYALRFAQPRGNYDFFFVPVLLTSAGIFVFFLEFVSKLDFGAAASGIIRTMSSCTLGIYLLHAFIIERINKLGLTTSSFSPAFSVPLIAISGFIVSFVIVFFYKSLISALKRALFKEKVPVRQ